MKAPKIYKKYLTESKVNTLLDIQDSNKYVEALSVRRRMGVNGVKNLSQYSVCKWDNMTVKDRDKIKKLTKKSVMDKCIISWFLKFPEGGKLDTIKTWANNPQADNIRFLAISLTDNSYIWLGQERYKLKAGEAINFSIQESHTVPTCHKESIFLLYMVAE